MNLVNSKAIVQESETRIKTAFDNILSNYQRARRKPFGREPALWRVFDELFYQLQHYISSRVTLKMKWSVGKGNWARAPWIAFLDKRETKSTQQGIYPVFLFREDLSGVYLALNQGISVIKKKHGRPESRRILCERAERLRRDIPAIASLKDFSFSVDNKIDLHTSGELEKDYEASIVAYKLYRRGEIVNDMEILDDLEQVLIAYDEYLERQPFREVQTPALHVTRNQLSNEFLIGSAIHDVISYIGARGFVYDSWQIAQYITAIRTKPFVILGGISGIGKSKLPSLITEATGGISDLLPVRPDWADSADVIGYTDLEGNFRPGPVLRLARTATANSDRLYTCIIDEMNLARVEQYLPEILSRIEDRQPQANGGYRTRPLVGHLSNEADAEWAQVVIPANFALVGTVNVDESTHDFSRKVLDRAFTIELSEVHLAHWNPNGRPVRAASPWPAAAWNPIKIELSELTNPTAAQRSEIKRAIVALSSVNNLLAPAQLTVGYRTRNEVAFYLLHAQQIADAFVDREGKAVDPLDLALQMKILPRIVGRGSAIRRCLLGLLGWATIGVSLKSDEEANSIVNRWDALGRVSALTDSKYPRLAARLCLMWQRFEADGYTSYWL